MIFLIPILTIVSNTNAENNFMRRKTIEGIVGLAIAFSLLLTIFILHELYPNHPVIRSLWILLWLVGGPLAIYVSLHKKR